MPKFRITAPNGRVIELEAPDRATAVAGAQEYVRRYPDANTAPRVDANGKRTPGTVRPVPPVRPAPQAGTPQRYAAAVGTGVVRGLAGMGDVLSGQAAASQLFEAATGSPAPPTLSDYASLIPFQPRGVGEEFAQTVGTMLPNAAVPGSLAARVAAVAVPSVANEGAGQAARAAGWSPEDEQKARLVATLGAAALVGSRITRDASAPSTTRPAPPRAPAAAAVNTPSGGFRIQPSRLSPAEARVGRHIERAIRADERAGGPSRAEVANRILAGERPWAAGGENLSLVAEDAASAPGSARSALLRDAQAVAAAAPAQVRSAITEATGANVDILQHLDDASRARMQAAAPLKERAFSQPVDPLAFRSRIEPIMPRIPQSALELATKIAERDGRNPNELGMMTVRRNDGSGTTTSIQVRNPTFETMHYIKKGMDQYLAQFRNQVTGQLDLEGQPLAQATAGVRREFGQALRGINPDYDAFMQRWGDDSEIMGAYNLGRDALQGRGSLRGQQLEQRFSEMSEQAQQEYRRGVGEALLDEVRSKGDVTFLRRLRRDEVLGDRIRLAFPGQTYETFLQLAEGVVQRQTVASQILGNARTALRGEARGQRIEGPDLGGYAEDAANFQPGSLARRGIRDATRNASQQGDVVRNQELNTLLGEAMTKPEVAARLLQGARNDPGLAAQLAAAVPDFSVTMTPEQFQQAAGVAAVSAAATSGNRRPAPPRR